MAEIDAEFRAAYAIFLRTWIGQEFFDRGHSEEDFEDAVTKLIDQGGPVTQMLRSFYSKHGRYPTFAEVCLPNMSQVGIIPDII
jgi:hypothetical protein